MLAIGKISSKYIVRFVLLPNNYDPDLFVREKGFQEFKNYLLDAKILSDFFFEYLAKKYSERTVESLNQLAHEDNLLQNLWYEKLAGLLGVDSNSLKQIKSNNTNTSKISNKFNKVKINYSYPITNAYRALAMLLIEPNLLQFCDLLSYARFPKLNLSQDIVLLIKIIELMKHIQSPEELKDVTILYADIAGFTKYSSSVSPEEVVKMLRNLYTQFDKACV